MVVEAKIAAASSVRWIPANQSLKFTLSDLTLAQFPFQAMVCDAPITSLLCSEAILPPENEVLHPLAGCVIRNFPTSGRLKSIQFTGSWLRYVPVQYRRYLVERNCDLDKYVMKFSSKSRKNLRRSVTRFAAEAGDGYWREYRSHSEVIEFQVLAAEVSSKTYQAKLFGDQIQVDAAERERLEALADDDNFRGYVLFHQGTPAAFALCEGAGDVLLYKHPGYAPEYKHLSPGTVLLWHILEVFFADDRFRFIDFGEGEGFYKEYFSNRTMSCARVYFFRRTPILMSIVVAHYGWSFLTNVVKDRLLPGVNSRLRRLLRSRSANAVQDIQAV